MNGTRQSSVLLPDDLPGYRRERIGSAHVIARDEALLFVREAIATAGTLYAYAGACPEAEVIAGRGTVYLIPGPGPSRWVVRRLTHGGLLAPLTRDRFLRGGTPRPFNELYLGLKLQDRGIATPGISAAVVYPSGPIYRGEVARDEITDALDLAACLFGETFNARQRLQALAASGRLLSSLHRAGVVHPDLNLRNVLIKWSDEAARAYILDLEKCRIVPQVSRRRRKGMLQRFRRSARKFAKRTGKQISSVEWERFDAAYVEALRGST
jgi:3-deoxy-D-manno-octulosonic acid kinase